MILSIFPSVVKVTADQTGQSQFTQNPELFLA